jgi:hypothetical protein
MSLKSKAILKAAQKRPGYLAIPLIPAAMMITNFLLAWTALRRIRRVSRRLAVT